jgi:hypothetical protein
MLAESRELLSSLTQQKSDLDRAAKDLQAGRAAYEKLLNQLNESSRLISQESQRLSGLAAQSEAASQRAIEAKQNVEKSALEACEKALLIKNSKSQAERDRLLPDVIAAAGRASSQARISKEQYEQSRKAMEEIQRILQLSGEANRISASTEWNQLQEIAQRIMQISGDTPTPVRRIEGIAAELTRIAAQAAAVRHQILETLKSSSTDQAAVMKKEMDQLYGSISAAEKETANIAAEARSLLASIQQTAGIASTIQTLQPPSSTAPAADKDSLARADSAAAVAETFSAQAADDAAKAQACANASRNRVPGEPPGSTDWDQAAVSAKSSSDTAT